MFSVSYIYLTRSNVKASLLSAVLIVSMFAIFAPATVTSVKNIVSPTAVQKLTTSVAESLGKETSEQMDIVVQTTDNAQVVSEIESLGGEVSQVYKSVEALAATVPADKILELASNPNVKRIYEDTVRYLASGETGPKPPDPGPVELELMEELPEANIIPLDVKEIGSVTPSTYHISKLTHAEEVWEETEFGAESTVAIIDTGCWNETYTDLETDRTYYPWYYIDDPNVTNVIGGIDLSYDVGTEYEGYGNPMNHYHGTACGYFLAAHVYIIFGDGHPWGEAIYRYDPEGTWKDEDNNTWVTCRGIAPSAEIYAIKVFDHTGGGIPSSIVMAGIDHAIQQKDTGAYDIDVISMSLGGGVGADGEDPEDLLVDAAREAGITVVVAAGNEGPGTMRVGSPGSAKTCITVGGATDPVHERVYADAVTGSAWLGMYYYPHDELQMWRWSSKGPTADGRLKPDVVATGSHLFFGLTPAELPSTIGLGSGTSFSTPQVSGEAALLNSYVEINDLTLGPRHIKKAIMEGAEPMSGFTHVEQGFGYIHIVNSLEILKGMPEELPPEEWPWHHHVGNLWFPPLDLLCLKDGKVTVNDIVLKPGRYAYFAFWVGNEVDSIKISVSGVELSDWNPLFGDSYNVYLTTAERGGIDSYLIGYPDAPQYFIGDSVSLVMMDTDCQPGVVRLVLENDFSSFGEISFDEVKVEVTELWVGGWRKRVCLYNRGTYIPEAQVKVYSGKIETHWGTIKEGETDTYTFEIPDETGLAYVILSWWRDWNKWATSDLDLIILCPDGTIDWKGATGASPEAIIISAALNGTGDYTILIDGYGVYFDKKEYYKLEIIYLADPSTPLWSSDVFSIDCFTCIKSPKYGVAIAWIYDLDFDYWYIGGFTKLTQRRRGCRWASLR